MKTIYLIALLLVSLIGMGYTGVLAQETSLVPASVFPHEIDTENYVPSLYFSSSQSEAERLVAAPNFPTETWDLCYCPSLYYEARKIAAVEAQK